MTDDEKARRRIELDHGVIYGCSVCRDHVRLNNNTEDGIPCYRCVSWGDDERRRRRIENIKKYGPKPEKRLEDLSDAEREIFDGYKARYPETSDLVVLLWVEGAMYVPAKDPDFVAFAKVLTAEVETLKQDRLTMDSADAAKFMLDAKEEVRGLGMKKVRALAEL